MNEPVRAEPIDTVHYPESDGEPMAETDLHRDEMIAQIESLKLRYGQDPNVYVAGNLLIYYEKGNAKARFAPDCFVVFGVPKRQRRVYELWEERAPDFVLEVSSKGTSTEDEGNEKVLCRRLGVREHFLFDPEGDYLEPRLQAYCLRGDDYERVPPGPDGSLRSETLGLTFRVEGTILRAVDTATGEPLLRPDEEHEARVRAERRLRDADARIRELEAERAALLARASKSDPDDGDR